MTANLKATIAELREEIALVVAYGKEARRLDKYQTVYELRIEYHQLMAAYTALKKEDMMATINYKTPGDHPEGWNLSIDSFGQFKEITVPNHKETLEGKDLLAYNYLTEVVATALDENTSEHNHRTINRAQFYEIEYNVYDSQSLRTAANAVYFYQQHNIEQSASIFNNTELLYYADGNQKV